MPNNKQPQKNDKEPENKKTLTSRAIKALTWVVVGSGLVKAYNTDFAGKGQTTGEDLLDFATTYAASTTAIVATVVPSALLGGWAGGGASKKIAEKLECSEEQVKKVKSYGQYGGAIAGIGLSIAFGHAIYDDTKNILTHHETSNPHEQVVETRVQQDFSELVAG